MFPSLLVCYFGQGAYLIASHPTAIGNPFYEMAPLNLRLPLVIIATVATVVASQALITGVFAMVHQASQLGYLPRVTIVHMSKQIEGRIYIPQANSALMVLCIALLFSWQRGVEMVSERLRDLQVPLARFIERINAGITRVPGTAVFLTREANGAPPLLVHYVDHCLALQEHIVLLTVNIEHVPRVPERERFTSSELGCGFHGGGASVSSRCSTATRGRNSMHYGLPSSRVMEIGGHIEI